VKQDLKRSPEYERNLTRCPLLPRIPGHFLRVHPDRDAKALEADAKYGALGVALAKALAEFVWKLDLHPHYLC